MIRNQRCLIQGRCLGALLPAPSGVSMKGQRLLDGSLCGYVPEALDARAGASGAARWKRDFGGCGKGGARALLFAANSVTV